MRTKMALAGAALAAAALIGGGAWACVPGASITLTPSSGSTAPPTNVTVSGSTFDAQGSPVNIYWDGTAGSLVGQAQVQADRSFSFSFVVPGNAQSGSHVVSATQLDRNGLAYNPVNRTFRVNGPRPANAPNTQGVAQPEQVDGATTPAPVAQPAAQPARAAAPAQASSPAQPGAPAPAPAVGTQAAPPSAPPTAPAADAQQGAAAQQPAGSQEAFRTPVPAPAPAGAAEAASSSGSGAPAWLLVPLAVLSLGFLGVGSGIFLKERRRVRVKA
jgi:hypothetical protein